MKYYIGLDFGTTNCKAIVFDEHINKKSEASCLCELIKQDGFIEQTVDKWWLSASSCIKSAVKKANIESNDDIGISVSSQGISFVITDKNNNPVRNAISWLDTRADVQAKEILTKIDIDEFISITGSRPTGAYTFPKLIWIKENESDNWKRASKIFLAHDYLIFKLCGAFITTPTIASGSLMLDRNKIKWNKKVLEEFGIPAEMLPNIIPSGTEVSKIIPHIAAELGLPVSTTIYAGAQDQKCAYIGAGGSKDVITVSLGTASAISSYSNTVFTDKKQLISCTPGLFASEYMLEGVVATCGAALNWAQSTLFSNFSYSQLDKAAYECFINGGTDIYFNPDFAYKSIRGGFIQNSGMISGLTLSASPGQIWLGLLEGIAFRIRERVEIIQKINKAKVIRLFGGGAVSNQWCEIIASVTGLSVSVCSDPETGAAGAAILAGAKLNGQNYIDISPNFKLVEKYNEKYLKFIRIFNTEY